MVITRTTRNRLIGDEPVRGFESHRLRHRPAVVCHCRPFYTVCRLFLLCRLLILTPNKHSAHSIGRFLLCCEVKVSVDVSRCGEGAVPQPDLNLLHRDSVSEEQAGAGMTKIVEANLFQPVFLDDPCKVLCYIVGT